MKIASYVLLGILSCIEVLAEQTAFDKAVEAYRTYQKARSAYFEAIYAHEETRLAWDALKADSGANDEARKKAATALKEHEVVKAARAIYQITGQVYHKAFISIPEVKVAWDAWEDALSVHRTVYRNDQSSIADMEEADRAVTETEDLYKAVSDVFEEAIKKAYEADRSNRTGGTKQIGSGF